MRAMSAAWVAYPSHGCGYIPYGSVSNKVSRDPPHCCTIPVGRGRGVKAEEKRTTAVERGSPFAGFCHKRCQHARQSFRLLLSFSEFSNPLLAFSLLQLQVVSEKPFLRSLFCQLFASSQVIELNWIG